MQGNLDNPPIIIYKSRLKSFGLCLVSIGFVLFAGNEIVDGSANLFLYAGLILFGISAPIWAYYMFKPPTLRIDPDGIFLSEFLTSRTLKWAEVRNFRAHDIGPYRWASKAVVFDVLGGPNQTIAATRRSVSGFDDRLTGSWTLGPKSLADLLNAARARWATP